MRAPALVSACLLVLAAAACGTRTIDPGNDVDAGSDAAADGSADTGADGASDAPSPSFFACNGEGASCALTVPSCCGGCGIPQLADVVAVAAGQTSAYHDYVCPDPSAVPCPGCPSGSNPSLQAVCRANVCVAIDLTKDTLSACATSADCQLRYASCCGSCGPTDVGLIAIAKTQDGAYTQAICSPLIDCAPCPGPVQYPAGKRAVCDATKHCVVQ
jgi:hypothetical protein